MTVAPAVVHAASVQAVDIFWSRLARAPTSAEIDMLVDAIVSAFIRAMDRRAPPRLQ